MCVYVGNIYSSVGSPKTDASYLSCGLGVSASSYAILSRSSCFVSSPTPALGTVYLMQKCTCSHQQFGSTITTPLPPLSIHRRRIPYCCLHIYLPMQVTPSDLLCVMLTLQFPTILVMHKHEL